MRFFVSDNSEAELSRLRLLLQTAFPDCNLWPENNKQVLQTWAGVRAAVLEHSEDAAEQIVFLDLCLSDDLLELDSAMKQAELLRSLRPNAVFIAYTKFSSGALRAAQQQEVFDLVIDKDRLFSFGSREEERNYLRQSVQAVLRKRHRTISAIEIKDSLGLRLAEAALGRGAIEDLTEEIAGAWTERRIEALTAGYSGASILAISGVFQGSHQRIIVKCARDRKTIEDETRRIDQYLSELGPLAESLGQIDRQIHPLPQGAGYYYRQAPVSGGALLDQLIGRVWDKEAKEILDGIVALELRCYEPSRIGTTSGTGMLSLSAIDVGRVEQSLQFLEKVARCIADGGHWPAGAPSVGEITEDISSLTRDWPVRVNAVGDLPCVAQHGDLNPLNILVPTPGKVVLIDFSRLGRWPVGYDLARLSLILRLRLTDSTNEADWVVNQLSRWVSEAFCSIDSVMACETSVCPPAAYCDQRLRSAIHGHTEVLRERIVLGYRVCIVWDLIKVLSYQDLSPFKRVWALIACWQLATESGLIADRR